MASLACQGYMRLMRDSITESKSNPLLLTRETQNFLVTVAKQHSNRFIVHRYSVPRPKIFICRTVDLTSLQIKVVLGVSPFMLLSIS